MSSSLRRRLFHCFVCEVGRDILAGKSHGNQFLTGEVLLEELRSGSLVGIRRREVGPFELLMLGVEKRLRAN